METPCTPRSTRKMSAISRHGSFGARRVSNPSLCRGCMIVLEENNKVVDALIEHHPKVVSLVQQVADWERKGEQWEVSRNMLQGSLRTKKETLAYIRATLYREILQLKEHLYLYQQQKTPELGNDFSFFDISRLVDGTEGTDYEEFERLETLLRNEHNSEKDRIRAHADMELALRQQQIDDLERSTAAYGAQLQDRDAKIRQLESDFSEHKAQSLQQLEATVAKYTSELQENTRTYEEAMASTKAEAARHQVVVQEMDAEITALQQALDTEKSLRNELAAVNKVTIDTLEQDRKVKELLHAHGREAQCFTATIDKLKADNQELSVQLEAAETLASELKLSLQEAQYNATMAEQRKQKALTTNFSMRSFASSQLAKDNSIDLSFADTDDELREELHGLRQKYQEACDAEAAMAHKVKLMEGDFSALQQQGSIQKIRLEERVAALIEEVDSLKHELDLKVKRERLFVHYTESAVQVVNKVETIVDDIKRNGTKSLKKVQTSLSAVKAMQQQLDVKFTNSGLKQVELPREAQSAPKSQPESPDGHSDGSVCSTADAACMTTVPEMVSKETMTDSTLHARDACLENDDNESTNTSAPCGHPVTQVTLRTRDGSKYSASDPTNAMTPLASSDMQRMYRSNPTFSQLTPPPSKPVAELLLALATLSGPAEITKQFVRLNERSALNMRPLTPSPFDERNERLYAAINKQWAAGSGVWSALEKEASEMTVWELLEARIYALLEYIAERKVVPEEPAAVDNKETVQPVSRGVSVSEHVFEPPRDTVFAEPAKVVQYEKGRVGGSLPVWSHGQRRGKLEAARGNTACEGKLVLEGQRVDTIKMDELVKQQEEEHVAQDRETLQEEQTTLRLKQLERLQRLFPFQPPTLVLTALAQKQPVVPEQRETLIFDPRVVEPVRRKQGFATPKVLRAMPHAHHTARYNHLPRPGSAPLVRK